MVLVLGRLLVFLLFSEVHNRNSLILYRCEYNFLKKISNLYIIFVLCITGSYKISLGLSWRFLIFMVLNFWATLSNYSVIHVFLWISQSSISLIWYLSFSTFYVLFYLLHLLSHSPTSYKLVLGSLSSLLLENFLLYIQIFRWLEILFYSSVWIYTIIILCFSVLIFRISLPHSPGIEIFSLSNCRLKSCRWYDLSPYNGNSTSFLYWGMNLRIWSLFVCLFILVRSYFPPI